MNPPPLIQNGPPISNPEHLESYVVFVFQVEYFKFPDAYARARVEKKLVHQILLWGVLDDQSC